MRSCNQPMKKPEALNFNTGTAAANTENNLTIHAKIELQAIFTIM